MSLKQGIGNVEYMKKRIPRNAKYQHVRTRLDTGCSLTKYMERLEDIKKNYRYRADEIFKRLKVTTFAQLILQVASVSDLNDDVDSHGPEGNATKQKKEIQSPKPLTPRSVVSGVGELSLDRKSQKTESEVSSFKLADRPYPDSPYLLLDVRDCDQYDCCHIVSAHSFPITKLSRTMNPYTKEVLEYKNAAGKIIIVYDEDERIASQAATIMCERGVENLFMLSGGLKVISQKFPEGMTTGSLPTSCLSCPASSKGKKSSVQHQQEPQAAEKRWRFTSDELVKIQEQLDEMLIPSNPNSRMSSRMSTLSSQSNASSAGSRLSSSTVGRNSGRVQSSRPWK
uniref:Centrosomal protein 41 n=1 Tax=Scophthalmus maximus TaxID=52904 RepID=A0A8D2ZE38_SCOMX